MIGAHNQAHRRDVSLTIHGNKVPLPLGKQRRSACTEALKSLLTSILSPVFLLIVEWVFDLHSMATPIIASTSFRW